MRFLAGSEAVAGCASAAAALASFDLLREASLRTLEKNRRLGGLPPRESLEGPTGPAAALEGGAGVAALEGVDDAGGVGLAAEVAGLAAGLATVEAGFAVPVRVSLCAG